MASELKLTNFTYDKIEKQPLMLFTIVLIIGTLIGFWLLYKSIDWFEKI
jgi:hypothetical protein